MKLSDVLSGLQLQIPQGFGDTDIKGVVCDSRLVREGFMFVCIKGFQQDGHAYAESAYRLGARVFAAIHPLNLPSDACVVIAPDTRKLLAIASANFYENPADKLTKIAITGTKGKTSTSFMLKSILEKAGRKVGVIGSTGIFYGDYSELTNNSTPESSVIHKCFADMVSAGIDTVIMETTSQGFMLDRTYGIDFEAGIFTNLSPDHIGQAEHSDFEDYLRCKRMIFAQSKIVFVNADSDYYDKIVENIKTPIVTFGIKNKADFCVCESKFDADRSQLKTEFVCVENDERHNIELNTPGYFSLYNAAGAIAAARHLGVCYDDINEGLKSTFVKGRMEIIPIDRRYTVIIDFAHNEFSVKSLFDTIKIYNPSRIISVFGCGGNRSKLRRYSMGEVIGRDSDYSIVTSDNSRYEKVEDIIADIMIGMKKSGGKYEIITDRRKAIKRALDIALDGDVILLIGKGHESYEEICGVKYPFDERQTVLDLIEAQTLQGS